MANLDENKKEELELDDLLLGNGEEEETKEPKSKKTILLVAIGVVLFAIIILVVYLLQGDSKQTTETNTLTSKPLEEAQLPQVTSKETTTDFGQVPIQSQDSSSSDEQFQKIIDQIKAQQKEQNLPNPPKEEVVTIEPKPAMKQVNNATTPSVPAASNAPSASNVPSTPAQPQKANEDETPKGFYIQVGSFSKGSPNQQLLSTIKDLNLEYRMQKSGAVNRLLVGPFGTKADAQNQLNLVKERINKDAFIKEIK